MQKQFTHEHQHRKQDRYFVLHNPYIYVQALQGTMPWTAIGMVTVLQDRTKHNPSTVTGQETVSLRNAIAHSLSASLVPWHPAQTAAASKYGQAILVLPGCSVCQYLSCFAWGYQENML